MADRLTLDDVQTSAPSRHPPVAVIILTLGMVAACTTVNVGLWIVLMVLFRLAVFIDDPRAWAFVGWSICESLLVGILWTWGLRRVKW